MIDLDHTDYLHRPPLGDTRAATDQPLIVTPK